MGVKSGLSASFSIAPISVEGLFPCGLFMCGLFLCGLFFHQQGGSEVRFLNGVFSVLGLQLLLSSNLGPELAQGYLFYINECNQAQSSFTALSRQ